MPVAWLTGTMIVIALLAIVFAANRLYSHKPLVPAALAKRVAAMADAGNRPPAPTSAGPQALPHNCVWQGPGLQRFRGTMPAALAAAGLPRDVVAKFTMMHDAGLATDRLEISGTGIRTVDHRRNFGSTTKAMALDDGICLDTRVDLPAGMSGTADLYELTDDNGFRYLVMSVARGENVAVLVEQPGR